MAADALTWAAQGSLLAAALSLLVLALHLRDLVRAIAAFAAESALTAGAFFVLASPFAASVERTVGAGVAALFLGGPFPPGIELAGWAAAVVGFAAFLAKTLGILFVLAAVRVAMGRIRIDQLNDVGWKYLAAAALLQILVVLLIVGRVSA